MRLRTSPTAVSIVASFASHIQRSRSKAENRTLYKAFYKYESTVLLRRINRHVINLRKQRGEIRIDFISNVRIESVIISGLIPMLMLFRVISFRR